LEEYFSLPFSSVPLLKLCSFLIHVLPKSRDLPRQYPLSFTWPKGVFLEPFPCFLVATSLEYEPLWVLFPPQVLHLSPAPTGPLCRFLFNTARPRPLWSFRLSKSGWEFFLQGGRWSLLRINSSKRWSEISLQAMRWVLSPPSNTSMEFFSLTYVQSNFFHHPSCLFFFGFRYLSPFPFQIVHCQY